MTSADIVSAMIAFLALVVAFGSLWRTTRTDRQAAHLEFVQGRNTARITLARLETAQTNRTQQLLGMLEEIRQVLDKARVQGLPEMRDEASELLESVLRLYRQVESGSQKTLFDLQGLHEQLAAIPAEEATRSDLPALQHVIGVFEQHKVKSDQWDTEITSRVSSFRTSIETLREAIQVANERYNVARDEPGSENQVVDEGQTE